LLRGSLEAASKSCLMRPAGAEGRFGLTAPKSSSTLTPRAIDIGKRTSERGIFPFQFMERFLFLLRLFRIEI